MPYILYKTDGTKITTVDDATLDLSTDLAFVGRNYSGYGQVVNENFLKLLENFSNDTEPSRPIRGQLWYNKSTGRINLCYDGKSFKSLANIFVQSDTPPTTTLIRGDLWWDSDAFQLKAYDGSRFQVVGPFNPAAGRATWIPGEEDTGPSGIGVVPIAKAVIDEETIAVVSKDSFTVVNPNLVSSFPTIKRGMTLSGADAQGNSNSSGVVMWGSAAHAVLADTATTALTALSLTSGGIESLLSSSSSNITSYYSTATTSTQSWTIMERDANGNAHANTFFGIATAALYADLAERYHADAEYPAGTVLVIGGRNEVTVTDVEADTAVVGIVSTKPAYMMNSGAGSDDTHPYIALKGRVPCKVVAPVKRGDLLVTSKVSGYAQSWKEGNSPMAVVGKALQSLDVGQGIIEVLVV